MNVLFRFFSKRGERPEGRRVPKNVLFRYLERYAFWIILAILLLFAQALGELELPKLMSKMVDIGVALQDHSYILSTGLKMLVLALVCGALTGSVGLLSARISAGFSRDMRHAVFAKVQQFSKREVDHFSTASLITRSTNDVQQVQNVVLMGIRALVFAPVMGIGGIVNALRTSPSLSWIIILSILLLILLLIFVLLVVMPKFKLQQSLIDRLNLVSREGLTGLLVTRAFGNEAHETGRLDAAAENLAKTERFVYRTMGILMPLVTLLMNAVSVMVVWFGAKKIVAQSLQIGDMLAFMQYAMHVVMSFMFLSMMFVMLPRAAVSTKRLKEVLDMESSVKEPILGKKLPETPRTIVFDHVSFRYAGAEENVLTDIHFMAEPGKTTAFIGATGSGKSTIVNLMERFYDVTEGKITIDGVDLREIPQAVLRREIGFVPQKAVIFSGNILSNVDYGNEKILEEKILEAIKVAQAENFVKEQEQGLQSHVAQGGANLSGGQKQRLSIARALARNPKIYIFDDSFSALDFKTDAALRRALKCYTDEATVFIVAQRVSTILHAEQIVVLDEGRIVGIGSHKELLSSCAVYREIAESQLSKEELA